MTGQSTLGWTRAAPLAAAMLALALLVVSVLMFPPPTASGQSNAPGHVGVVLLARADGTRHRQLERRCRGHQVPRHLHHRQHEELARSS